MPSDHETASREQRVEALADVLLASWKAQGGLHPPFDTDRADAIEDATRLLDSPAMRDLLAEAKADALREAADEAVTARMYSERWWEQRAWRSWLMQRAGRIEHNPNPYRETSKERADD